MKAFAALILMSLVVSLLTLASPIKAQEPLNLTIKPDGSIEPNTGFTWLQRKGNIYTFIGDIFGTITVQKDYITIDGAGYTLQGIRKGIELVGKDRSHRICTNVLIKNTRICTSEEGIFSIGSSNNSLIGNHFENTLIRIGGSYNSTADLIKHNVIKNTTIQFEYCRSGIDVITENNFYNSRIFIWLSNYPIVDKNYWSDYETKYPNAKVLADSATWNTQYALNPDDNGFVDYHPLINPVTDFEIPGFNNPTLTPLPTPPITTTPSQPNFGPTSPPTTSPSQQPTINTGAYQPQAEPFLTTLAVAAIIVVAVVGAGLLVYYKKYNRKAKTV